MSPPYSSSFSEHYMNLSHKTMFMTLYIVFLLVFGSYNATARMIGPIKLSETTLVQTRSRQEEIIGGFRFKGRVFHLFSKRVLVPPSGPSVRHNSVVNNLKH
ncbi:protein IDA-LIKE 1 [Arabidopsis lyrata subsp. lyrata]|nr:protein IDA-LIKE 1 [Arabidopsis lyrata subsp. lyrata]|eukprot:XP_002876923.2 protein IDA-LIKE 1 [Arabidopsis lyrata subsp. lyrata]